jgi:osmoprotectant transport system substrate-binding protein
MLLTSGWRVLFGVAVLAVVSCAPGAAPGVKPEVRIGSTNFSEQVLLAELYSQILEANGYKVERRFNLGSREIVAPALESGQIDMYVEYMATYLSFLTKDPTMGSSDPVATYRSLQDTLRAKNLVALEYAPAANVNGWVVTKETSDRQNLKKVSDLTRINNQFTVGGPPECPDRPFCLQGLERTYGVRPREFRALDVGGPLTVAALEGRQIDVAVLFSTDAAIQAKNFVLLDDDKRLQLADNVVPVARKDFIDRAMADFTQLVNSVSTRMTTEELTSLNRQIGVDRKEPRDVAREWLRAKGLVR